MNPKISFLYIVRNEERTIRPSILSIINYAHEVIVVLDPRSNDKTKDILMGMVKTYPNIKVFLHPFISDGHQRSYSLRVADPTANWYWIIDGDEVITDNIPNVIELLKKTKLECISYEGVHFVYDFKHIDATIEQHIWYNRIVRNNGKLYFNVGKQHGLIQGYDTNKTGTLNGIVVYHYGKVKGPFKFLEDTAVTRAHGYEIHDPENHDKMVKSLVEGKFPVKEFEGKHPSVMGLQEWGL